MKQATTKTLTIDSNFNVSEKKPIKKKKSKRGKEDVEFTGEWETEIYWPTVCMSEEHFGEGFTSYHTFGKREKAAIN